MVNLARKNLLHDKFRFAITVAGVAFAVTLVLVQVGLFVGLLSNATTTIEHLGADLWVTSHNTPNIDFPHIFSETRVNRVRSIAGVQRADNLFIGYLEAAQPSGAQESTLVYAMENFVTWDFPWNMTAGDVSDLRRGDFMILDESARKRFGDFKVGDYREVMSRRLRIIGTSRDALSFTTTPISFIDYRLVQSLMGDRMTGQTTYIVAKLVPGANVEAVRKEIARRLPYNDVFTAQEWATRSRNYWMINTGLGMNMGLTVFLGLLVGVVVVAQTLYTSTMEHIKEFGTVKAIGGSNSRIYSILAQQATIAALVGFILGAIPSYAMRPVMLGLGLKLVITPQLAAVVLVGTVLLCLAAAVMSFGKVASIDPALVFRA